MRPAACVLHASRLMAGICLPVGPLPHRATIRRPACGQGGPLRSSPHVCGARRRPTLRTVLAGRPSRRALAFLLVRARRPQAALRAHGKNETRAPPSSSVRRDRRTPRGALAARGAGGAHAAGAPARPSVPRAKARGAQQKQPQQQRQRQQQQQRQMQPRALRFPSPGLARSAPGRALRAPPLALLRSPHHATCFPATVPFCRVGQGRFAPLRGSCLQHETLTPRNGP
jgi:hypothetical protein